MADIFLKLQYVVLMGFTGCGGRRHFIKMNLEWDETGQAMQLRRGLTRVNGVMPTLVSCRT